MSTQEEIKTIADEDLKKVSGGLDEFGSSKGFHDDHAYPKKGSTNEYGIICDIQAAGKTIYFKYYVITYDGSVFKHTDHVVHTALLQDFKKAFNDSEYIICNPSEIQG